jgi:hypothetical protein
MFDSPDQDREDADVAGLVHPADGLGREAGDEDGEDVLDGRGSDRLRQHQDVLERIQQGANLARDPAVDSRRSVGWLRCQAEREGQHRRLRNLVGQNTGHRKLKERGQVFEKSAGFLWIGDLV